MKKTFWSLAALMLMAAPMMTSCSNDLDEVAPVEEQSNVVTITIAPPVAEPETRLVMDADGLTIASWAAGDVVNLYKATAGQTGYEEIPAKITGTGVAFICTDASTGTFSATLPDGENIDNYNLAIFGGTADNYKDSYGEGIKIKPTTWSSKELKDVVMMGAVKEGASFTMKIINNVMQIENTTTSDVEVAWYGYNYYSGSRGNQYFELACFLGTADDETWRWYGYRINLSGGPTLADAPHFTLAKSAVNYVNLPMVNGYTDNDQLGLYTSDATAVVPMKGISGRVSNSNYWETVYCGHLLDAGTYPAGSGS